MLDNFETKSGNQRQFGEKQPSKLTRIVISLGLAQTQKQAEYILLAVVVIIIVSAFIIWPSDSSEPSEVIVDPWVPTSQLN